MTRAQKAAYRLRWLILIVGLICLALGIWWAIGLPPYEMAGMAWTPEVFLPFNMSGDSEIIVNGLIWVGILVILEWLFLRPRRGWMFRLTATGRPLRTTVVAAAFMAMLLTVDIIATLLELPDWWEAVDDVIGLLGFWHALSLLWGIWILVFYIYWRLGDRFTQMGKMIRGLIAGSFFELFIAAGVFAWDRTTKTATVPLAHTPASSSTPPFSSGHSDQESSSSS